MFRTRRAKSEFQKFADANIKKLPVEQAFSSLLDFYRDMRASDARSILEGGDMLLFQWGTYDWGSGEKFEVNLTRQLILPDSDEDDDIWQLMLTYYFNAESQRHSVGGGNRWCETPNELPVFREFVLASAALKFASQHKPAKVELIWEHV